MSNERKGLHFDNSPELYATPPGRAAPEPAKMQYDASPGLYDGVSPETIQLYDVDGNRVAEHAEGYTSLKEMVTHANINRARLALRSADLTSLRMPKSIYVETDFRGAALDRTEFHDSDLRSAHFDDATGAPTFYDCDLRNATGIRELRERGARFVNCKGVPGAEPEGEE